MAELSDAAVAGAQLELVITRVFDAPRELVYRAWTERDRVLQWLGPAGFTGIEFAMDERPGGAWQGRMRGPDGTEHANGGRVREAVAPERLVFTFAWDEEDGTPGREMLITITLADRGGRTEMTFHQAAFESAEDRDGHIQGWSESFDKLAQYLAAAA
jgi:uncharacterized protein YndB with AHSA1/START domain